jgi:DtxR family Mn-dependent transcriptional regulator
MGPKNKKIFSKAGLTSTMEDYLETIYFLSQKHEVVRVKDIAENMGVRMPTVTSMLKKLNKKGMIAYERYETVELTPKGSDLGNEIDQRHRAISSFLTDILMIGRDQADQDACRIEHSISRITLKRLMDFMEFVGNCPRTANDWLTCFNGYKKNRRPSNECCVHKEKRSCAMSLKR